MSELLPGEVQSAAPAAEDGEGAVAPTSTHRPWVSRAMALAVVAPVCLAAYWYGFNYGGVEQRKGGLRVADADLDFGEVWETDKFSWEVRIENSGDDDIPISTFQASCSCVSIEPKSAVLPAKGKITLKLVLDLRGRKKEQISWRFEEEVAAQMPNRVVEWRVGGTVKRAIFLSSPVIDLGETCVGGPPLSGKLTVTANLPLRKLVVNSGLPGLTLDVKQLSEQKYEIGTTLEKPAETRRVVGAVTLMPFGRDGKILTALDVPVKGVVLSDVQAIPREIVFGPIGNQYDNTTRFVIQSITGKPFRLEKIEFPPGLDVRDMGRQSPSEKRLVLSVKKIKPGSQRQLISCFLKYDGTTTSGRVEIPVLYYGSP